MDIVDPLNHQSDPGFRALIIAMALEEGKNDYLRSRGINPDDLGGSVGEGNTRAIKFYQMSIRAASRYFPTATEPKPIDFNSIKM